MIRETPLGEKSEKEGIKSVTIRVTPKSSVAKSRAALHQYHKGCSLPTSCPAVASTIETFNVVR